VAAVRSNIETLSQKMAEARSIQHSARCKDLMFRQTAEFPRDPGHDVARVGDDDDDSVWAVFDQLRYDSLEDFNVLLHKIKTRLAFIPTSSSSDDDHTRILQPKILIDGWLRGAVGIERRSLAGELSLSCVRPAADG